MKRKPRRSVDELMDEGTLVDAALRRAARDALRRHKLAGVPIAVWRDEQKLFSSLGITIHVLHDNQIHLCAPS
jgi:hypothetical protein